MPNSIIDINSESLLTNTEQALKPLFDSLNLVWEDELDDVDLNQVLSPSGNWRHFSELSSEIAEALKSKISLLNNMLPFESELNWKLSGDFKYKDAVTISKKSKSKVHTTPITTTKTSSASTMKMRPQQSGSKVEVDVDTSGSVQEKKKTIKKKDTKLISDSDNDELVEYYESIAHPSERKSIKDLSVQLPFRSNIEIVRKYKF